MIHWFELLSIAGSICFVVDQDVSPIWQYDFKGIYSSRSLYAIINFRGVQPIYLPAVWQKKVPPRLHGFLWLFS